MHIDKKILRSLFALAGGCILLVWVLLYSDQVSALLAYVSGLIAPFVAGACVAFVFNVPMRAIEGNLEGIRKRGIRRALAIVLTLAALILVVAFVVELLIPQIQTTMESLAQSIPAFFKRTVSQIMTMLEDNPELRDWLMANTGLENLKLDSFNWTAILEKVGSFVSTGVTTILDKTLSAIGGVAGALVNGVISLAFSVYCLAQKETLSRQGRMLLYAFLPEKSADETVRVMRLTNATFGSFISGQCLEAVILGALFAVCMVILGLPYIPLVSVIIAVTALVPIVGAFVGCALSAFFILVNDPLQAVTFVAMFLVLQQLEGNLIYPRVVGTSVGLPGMWVLVAVTVGGELMGVAGMLVMIPLASVLYTLLREATAKRLMLRDIPDEKLQPQPPILQSREQKSKQRAHRLEMNRLKEKFRNIQNKK